MKNTDEKIIEAAKVLFSTKGYAATTTKDISSSAGISEVTLFRHFESKRKLFQCALKNTFETEDLISFFDNELKYDLDTDLKKLAEYLYTLYETNGPMIKMVMKDKDHNELHEMIKPQLEEKFRIYRDDYFMKMHKMGKIEDDPVMCSKFFFSNTMGFLMRKFVLSRCNDGIEYYNWMIEKTIQAIKTKN